MSDIDLSGLSVTLAMPVRSMRDITVPTTVSLMDTIDLLHNYDIPHSRNILVGDTIDHTRSRAVARFLSGDRNRLFFLDSDLRWRAEDFIKLLALSTEYQVIGAAYRAKRDPPFYLWNPGEEGLVADVRGCLPANGIGLGFTCIQRGVLEQLSAKAPVRNHLPNNDVFPDIFRFDRVGPEGGLRGEDFSFFSDVRDLGYVPRLDPSIELGHLGDKEFSGRVSDNLVRADGIAA